jgi:hypothetical protein
MTLTFTAYMCNSVDKETYAEIRSPFFDGLISDILTLFKTGKLGFDPEETIAVSKLIELSVMAANEPK